MEDTVWHIIWRYWWWAATLQDEWRNKKTADVVQKKYISLLFSGFAGIQGQLRYSAFTVWFMTTAFLVGTGMIKINTYLFLLSVRLWNLESKHTWSKSYEFIWYKLISLLAKSRERKTAGDKSESYRVVYARTERRTKCPNIYYKIKSLVKWQVFF